MAERFTRLEYRLGSGPHRAYGASDDNLLDIAQGYNASHRSPANDSQGQYDENIFNFRPSFPSNFLSSSQQQQRPSVSPRGLHPQQQESHSEQYHHINQPVIDLDSSPAGRSRISPSASQRQASPRNKPRTPESPGRTQRKMASPGKNTGIASGAVQIETIDLRHLQPPTVPRLDLDALIEQRKKDRWV